MNQEDILKMAREAGFYDGRGDLFWVGTEGLERFAALVATKALQDAHSSGGFGVKLIEAKGEPIACQQEATLTTWGDISHLAGMAVRYVDGEGREYRGKFPESANGIRVTRIELTERQRSGLQADCKGPLPAAGKESK